MPPKKNKKPVTIGLTKKRSLADVEEEEEVDGDLETPILSESCMETLEDIVGEEVLFEANVDVVQPQPASIDLFEDDDDEGREDDPDYVNPVAGPSHRSMSKTKSTSKKTDEVPKLEIRDPAKARSKGLIWAFFVIDDQKVPNLSGVGTCIEKGAKCQVQLEGAGGQILCNARLKQGSSTTSGLNSHLHSRHPKAWAALEAAKRAEEKEKKGVKRQIEDMFDELEGTPPSKSQRQEPMSGVKRLPLSHTKSPFIRELKYERRGKMQQTWEMWITEYWARLGLPWSKLDHPAHKEFWAKVNPKYHMKCSSTYSRSKLPLLFDQVKKAVDKKIQKDMLYTSGVGITADHWTSRNDDPYIGLTLHVISKDWTLDR